MAARRLRSCRLTAFPAILLLLLLLLLQPQAMQGSITCPMPVSVEHADIRVKNYSVSSRERYTCNSGFKRKAGTSSLTECVLNETTNTAHWTTPNLKCIRDPSLTRQIPVSPSTVATTRVTTQPESLAPSRKEPEAFTRKSDTTVTTETAIEPGSRLLPSEPPSEGTPGIVRNGSSPAPPQTTAKTLEPILPASYATPDASSGNATTVTGTSTAITVAAPLVILIIGGVAAITAYYRKRRQQLPAPNVEMEDMPMTAETTNRQKNTDDHEDNL